MNTAISIRTDLEVKNAAQQIAQSVGISLSALINSYLRQIIATRRIELYAREPMTPKLESLIAEVETQLQSGQVSEKFTTADDFLIDLNK